MNSEQDAVAHSEESGGKEDSDVPFGEPQGVQGALGLDPEPLTDLRRDVEARREEFFDFLTGEAEAEPLQQQPTAFPRPFVSHSVAELVKAYHDSDALPLGSCTERCKDLDREVAKRCPVLDFGEVGRIRVAADAAWKRIRAREVLEQRAAEKREALAQERAAKMRRK